jgi:toxin FitB
VSAFLLDTVAISALRVAERNPEMASWFEAHAADDMFVSCITIGELDHGIALTRDERFAAVLRAWLTQIEEQWKEWMLPFDLQAARVWGRTNGALGRRGLVAPVIDSMLAATAIVHDLIIVTRNTRDFEHFGVAATNPWEEPL